MLETKTHFKNELKSDASLILTFSLPFLPYYQNHQNAPEEGTRSTKMFGPSKEGEGGNEGEGGDDITPVAHGRRKVENGDQTPQ